MEEDGRRNECSFYYVCCLLCRSDLCCKLFYRSPSSCVSLIICDLENSTNKNPKPDIYFYAKKNKTGNVRITQQWSVSLQLLLQWKRNDYYIFCVCVCVCVFVALTIQHGMLVRHIVMWSVRLCTIFPLYVIKGMIFEKKNVTEKKMITDFAYSFVWNISNYKDN